jgi:VanZ family protein
MSVRRTVIAANLVYAIALMILGLIPSVPGAGAGLPDHVAHAAAYAIQAVLLFVLFLRPGRRGRTALLALGVAVLYGGCVEILQSLQPARTVEFADLVANAVGASSAALILYLVAGAGSTEARR